MKKNIHYLNFLNYEIIPVQSPLWLDWDKVKKTTKKNNEYYHRIFWKINSGKNIPITITLPCPHLFKQIYDEWNKIEKDFIRYFSSKNNYFHIILNKDPITSDKQLHNDGYFNYKYPLKYKDYIKGIEWSKNEKNYKYISKIDIKNYFPSIYLHSFEWVETDNKNNLTTKNNNNDFLRKISKFTIKYLNYGETNGLSIGPNLSLIISQILGQKIDSIILKKIKNEKILEPTIFRFVDDTFILHNKKLTENIINEINDDLSFYRISYKLDEIYLNKRNTDDTREKIKNWELSSQEKEVTPRTLSNILTGLINKLYINLKNKNINGIFNFVDQIARYISDKNNFINFSKSIRFSTNLFFMILFIKEKKSGNISTELSEKTSLFIGDIFDKMIKNKIFHSSVWNTMSPLIIILSILGEKNAIYKIIKFKKNSNWKIELPFWSAIFYYENKNKLKKNETKILEELRKNYNDFFGIKIKKCFKSNDKMLLYEKIIYNHYNNWSEIKTQ